MLRYSALLLYLGVGACIAAVLPNTNSDASIKIANAGPQEISSRQISDDLDTAASARHGGYDGYDHGHGHGYNHDHGYGHGHGWYGHGGYPDYGHHDHHNHYGHHGGYDGHYGHGGHGYDGHGHHVHHGHNNNGYGGYPNYGGDYDSLLGDFGLFIG